MAKKCKECPYFKILYMPLRGGGTYDLGRATCEKHDLIVDFANMGKIEKLECAEGSLVCEKEQGKTEKIILKPFDWNDNFSEIAQENFSLIQKSLSYGTASSIGLALAKLELLEKQGCKVEVQEREE